MVCLELFKDTVYATDTETSFFELQMALHLQLPSFVKHI